MEKISNYKELTDMLTEEALYVKTDKTSLARAKIISTLAGRIIENNRIKLEYQKARMEKPNIAFMECDNICK